MSVVRVVRRRRNVFVLPDPPRCVAPQVVLKTLWFSYVFNP